MKTAPNTPGNEITRGGAYHSAGTGRVSSNGSTPAKCRQCRDIANPAHVTNGVNDGLLTWCAEHCPVCVKFRNRQTALEAYDRAGM